MTCIVGIADGERCWIGGDSAGVSGYDVSVRADAKVFAKGDMVFGFCGSFRLGQLLRYSLGIPKHHEGDDMEYLVTSFVDTVRQCFKDHGLDGKKDGEERAGGAFLVGYRGNIYCVQSDFQVSQRVGNIEAIGCGDSYALGSLYSSIGTPDGRIDEALRCAAAHSGGVLPPFNLVSTKAAK